MIRTIPISLQQFESLKYVLMLSKHARLLELYQTIMMISNQNVCHNVFVGTVMHSALQYQSHHILERTQLEACLLDQACFQAGRHNLRGRKILIVFHPIVGQKNKSLWYLDLKLIQAVVIVIIWDMFGYYIVRCLKNPTKGYKLSIGYPH